jgi:hypothetical protein
VFVEELGWKKQQQKKKKTDACCAHLTLDRKEIRKVSDNKWHEFSR